MTPARLAAIIPARVNSSRLPGKALLEFYGLPMVEHVRRRAVLSRAFAEVAVATCDEPIAEAVRSFGGRVIMTAATHPGALDRVAEAMRTLEATHVVNVQGDEILIPPDDLARVARAVVSDPGVTAWNAAAPVVEQRELDDPSIVKLFVSRSGRIFHCARRCRETPVVPPRFEPLMQSVGIMAFTPASLEQFLALPRTPLETALGVDQLRLVEHDLPMHVVRLERAYPTINEPREIPLVRAAFEHDPLQQRVLQQVLALDPRPMAVSR